MYVVTQYPNNNNNNNNSKDYNECKYYTSTPQLTSGADAQLTEGQSVLVEQTLINVESLIYRAGIRRSTVSKT
jgi:hypothetical protein